MNDSECGRECDSFWSKIAQSIAVGKDGCHVVYLLHWKLSIYVHFGNIHAGAFDGVYVRFSSRGPEEKQLHAKPDNENYCDSDDMMGAYGETS